MIYKEEKGVRNRIHIHNNLGLGDEYLSSLLKYKPGLIGSGIPSLRL